MSNSSTNSESNKKAKTEEADFAAVRAYLERSPFGAEHPAVRAAVAGIDREQQRRQRDSRLQAKFAAQSMSAAADSAGRNNLVVSVESEDADVVKVERPMDHADGKEVANTEKKLNNREQIDDSMEEEEDWQNVDNNEAPAEDVGSVLAKQAVAALSENNVQCGSPTAALAAVLHAALLQTGFSCTGIPEPASAAGGGGGFAAPIRNLKGFLPVDWDKSPTIRLRYRKPDMGAVVLSVAPSATAGNGQVQITLGPANSSKSPEHEPNVLHLNVSDHINLESFQRAAGRNSKVPPALHFKALATLLTRFGAQFDLGNHHDTFFSSSSAPYVDYTMLQQRQTVLPNNNNNNMESFPVSNSTTTVFSNPTPGTGPPGDFSGDLTPTGIHQFPGSGGMTMPGSGPGNLMGPNHPMFGRAGVGPGFGNVGGAGDFGPGFGNNGIVPSNTGVGTMRPRFDPFGPPGGPTEERDPSSGHPRDPDGNILHNDPLMQPRKKGAPPGGTGVPNNDLAKPPPMPNNDMFL